MNEEIDIIELLKRVKEGKAPKEIEIEETKYEFQKNYTDIVLAYQTEDDDNWLENEIITLDTKIKILDKPIIEEMKESYNTVFKDELDQFILDVQNKINEIIRVINNKE